MIKKEDSQYQKDLNKYYSKIGLYVVDEVVFPETKEITLEINRGTDQTLMLHAKTMNELVEKIIEWQLWENQPLDYYVKKGTLDEERESGWYYFNK